MNVGSALKLTCVGMTGGMLMRLIGMLFFYDYNTGFYDQYAFYPWLCLLFSVVFSVIAAYMCGKNDRVHFGAYVARKNIITGIVSAVSGMALVGMAIIQIREHIAHYAAGNVGRNYAQSSAVHLIYIGASFIFGLLQFFSSVGFFFGKNYFTKLPVLYLLSVLWGVANIIFIFVYYAKSALGSENAYMIFGASSMLLCLYYMSKTISGIGSEKEVKRSFITGFFAININVSYFLSNLIAVMLGNDYYSFGEIPVAIQGANLSMAVFILAFLFTFRKYSISRKRKQMYSEEETENKKPSHSTRTRFRAD